MKVLMINGSPNKNGNTIIALNEIGTALNENGIDFEIVSIGSNTIRGCTACGGCSKISKCVIDDCVNEINEKFKNCDGLIIGTPVYYASANGTLISLLDRLFMSGNFDKTMKVGASVAVARRGGITATFDELNKYFTISGMPIASSNYWNGVHGRTAGEANEDKEGLCTMRTLGNNMAFLIKSINLGKEKYGLPKKEETVRTSFIR